MGLLILLQVALDLGFIAIVTLLLIERSKSKTVEDPRMSRGLQLLTSKIAILEDLMDRSETIGRQLTQLIDSKQQDVHERIEEVEVHLHKIQRATEKSQEVARIFQDRIPHQEIIERQTTVKYLQAAKMAHQGFSIDDIAKQLDIPRGELELIVKVNRDRLLNDKDPQWAPVQEPNPAAFRAENEVQVAPSPAPIAKKQEDAIRPVIFKRISVTDDLG